MVKPPPSTNRAEQTHQVLSTHSAAGYQQTINHQTGSGCNLMLVLFPFQELRWLWKRCHKRECRALEGGSTVNNPVIREHVVCVCVTFLCSWGLFSYSIRDNLGASTMILVVRHPTAVGTKQFPTCNSWLLYDAQRKLHKSSSGNGISLHNPSSIHHSSNQWEILQNSGFYL